jgi:hypothetical protein
MELENLYKEIVKIKNDVLMEEPCPLYEPEWEDCGETIYSRAINTI